MQPLIWGLVVISAKKKPLRKHGFWQPHSRAARTEVKAIFSFEPSPESAVMMATDMPAAISAYSMTVAPLSSRAKRARSLSMFPALRRPFGMAASQPPARFDIVAQFAKIECNSVFSALGAGSDRQEPRGQNGLIGK